MKFFLETTAYGDDIKNGVYLLDDTKSKMYAYVNPTTGDVKTFKRPISIYIKGRSFKEVNNTFGYKIPKEVAEHPRWEVAGSKGDKYFVEQTNNGLTCTCSGFKFRGECKHARSIKDKMGTLSTQTGSVATSGSGLALVSNPRQISRRRTG
jgi:hypothetical protein